MQSSVKVHVITCTLTPGQFHLTGRNQFEMVKKFKKRKESNPTENDEVHDLPPTQVFGKVSRKRKETSVSFEEDAPKKFLRVMRLQENDKNTTTSKKKNKNESLQLKLGEGETYQEFKRRVKESVKQELQKIPMVKLPGPDKSSHASKNKKAKKSNSNATDFNTEEKTSDRKFRNQQNRKEKQLDKKLAKRVKVDEKRIEKKLAVEGINNGIRFNDVAEAPPKFTQLPKQTFKKIVYPSVKTISKTESQNMNSRNAAGSKTVDVANSISKFSKQDAIGEMVKRTSRVKNPNKSSPLDKMNEKRRQLKKSQEHLSPYQINNLEKEREMAIQKYRMLKMNKTNQIR
ncbi:hypothetical protein AX774_g2760 [Zancudomyces culisetae]|uniref:Uncharacterized protein n=1 Tax=Zancudomyces culisetae TaxID=1213189 RepID=A0A1R1PRY6_ZANCU|nr:hypothetical protein AX774_g2760 [Zancudomyces culisetae]|eukprot:OMH83745.1 hypothetical protein AX774_g2760 [Zancudomyces culisetae]